jgi:6-phosphogluconolactonase/glucosamine-6-phosphate isomerase/deaminase
MKDIIKRNYFQKKLNLKYFENKSFNICVSSFLKKKISNSKNIIVTGGKTILPIYKILSKKKTFYKKNIFLSDERLVSLNSSKSNYKNIKCFFEVLKDKNNFFYFNFLKFKKFSFYNVSKKFSLLKNALNRNPIDLSILTIGKKCHIASIFFEKLKNKKQFFFKLKLPRVSIPLNLLQKSKLTIFLCKKEKLAYDLAYNFKKKKNLFKYFDLNKTIFLFNKKSYKVFIEKINK